MRYAFFAIVVLLTLLAPAEDATAQENWVPDKPPSTTYSATFKLARASGVCYVDVHADGSGLTLVASYDTGNAWLMQQITVTAAGIPQEQRYWLNWENLIYGSDQKLLRTIITGQKLGGDLLLAIASKGMTVVSRKAGLEEDVRDAKTSAFRVVPDIFGTFCANPAGALPAAVRQQLLFAYKSE